MNEPIERLNYSSAGAVRDRSKPRPEQHDAHVDAYIVNGIAEDWDEPVVLPCGS